MKCFVALGSLLALACSSNDRTSADAPDAASPDATPETEPLPPPLAWSPCTEPDLQELECATLEAPMDYEHPEDGTVQIAVSRMRATDPGRRLGVLLTNPGGPGAAGRGVTGLRDYFVRGGSPDVLARFDVIGFDPRGYGASTPSVVCGPLPVMNSLDYTPDDATERQTIADALTEVAAACESLSGPILKFVDSYSVARDMDRIRRALREDEISYFGGSYGTVLGGAYANLFPTRLRAAALSGGIPPNLSGPDFMRGQTQAYERAFAAFATDCANRPECASRFPGGIDQVFDATVSRMEGEPLVAGASLLTDSMVAFAASGTLSGLPETSADLEQVVEDAAGGNGGALLARTFIIGAMPILNAVHCVDRTMPSVAEAYDTLLPELVQNAPRFGHADFVYGLHCAAWPYGPTEHAWTGAPGAPPILVVGGTGDPATPYEWSEKLAAALDTGVLLTRDGVGHGMPNHCVNEYVRSYLEDLAVPEPGTVCPTP